ncbi:MAG: hypothetical protein V3V06_00715 [Dehalococcoidia bacterium]
MADILAQLDQRNEKSLAAWMRGSCKIVQGEDDVVTLAFAPTYVNMHKSKVEEAADTIAAVASEVVGRTVTIRCTAAEEESPKRSALVAEAERLGAKVVSRTGE